MFDKTSDRPHEEIEVVQQTEQLVNSHSRLTLDNLELRLGEKNKTQIETANEELNGLISDQSFNDIDKDSVAKYRSALFYWQQSRMKDKRYEESQNKFEGCTFQPQPGKQIRTKRLVEEGTELKFLSSQSRLLQISQLIDNFVVRNKSTGYIKKGDFGQAKNISIGLSGNEDSALNQ